jgi:hypothetical protein
MILKAIDLEWLRPLVLFDKKFSFVWKLATKFEHFFGVILQCIIANISSNNDPIKKVHTASCRATISLQECLFEYSLNGSLVPAL